MTSTTMPPYVEHIGCRYEYLTDDGFEHDHDPRHDCDYIWRCGTCGRGLDDGPCAEHAPTAFPGLQLADCTADPPHVAWVYASDGYPAPCMSCAYDQMEAAHRGCETCRPAAEAVTASG